LTQGLAPLGAPEIERVFREEYGRAVAALVRVFGEIDIAEDLCTEAVRLGRLLAELMPDEPEVMGLLALTVLVESRRAARTTAEGEGDLVPLADQDRGLWDRRLVAEGPSESPGRD
jgi:predicted RNA polymerase sigma factor